jgi:hypothetical protein
MKEAEQGGDSPAVKLAVGEVTGDGVTTSVLSTRRRTDRGRNGGVLHGGARSPVTTAGGSTLAWWSGEVR